MHCLEIIQHSAARIIMCIKRHDRQSITAVLRQLNWLPVKWHINYKIVVPLTRKCHELSRMCLVCGCTCVPRPSWSGACVRINAHYDIRTTSRQKINWALLCVPRHNLERYGRRSISCAGPVLWNSLPEDMRLADGLTEHCI